MPVADITGFDGRIQVAKYDAGDAGFYTWHMDNGNKTATRKISVSVQLSASTDYDGGDFEFMYSCHVKAAERTRGALIAFPSWVMHRVTPVTRGTRYSMVAWVVGPRWR